MSTEAVKGESEYRYIMITLKEGGSFVVKLYSSLLGGLQSAIDVECKLDLATSLNFNVVVRY